MRHPVVLKKQLGLNASMKVSDYRAKLAVASRLQGISINAAHPICKRLRQTLSGAVSPADDTDFISQADWRIRQQLILSVDDW